MTTNRDSSQLRSMISLQAEAIRQVAGFDLDEHRESLGSARRVLLTGTGTSLHAAQLGALMFQSAGIDAWALPSVTMAQTPPPPRGGDLLIVISHTGETAYALAARAAAHRDGHALGGRQAVMRAQR